MKYTDKVLKHPLFIEYTERIKIIEKDRIYCGHQLEHGLDVARLSWLCYLEDKMSADNMTEDFFVDIAAADDSETNELEIVKDFFYTCALLHDIGRIKQYETGIHHSVAGPGLAKRVLEDIQAPELWKKQILNVIAEHSQGRFAENDKSLEYYIMKADHDCRLCFACEARATCKWSDDEMNHSIIS